MEIFCSLTALNGPPSVSVQFNSNFGALKVSLPIALRQWLSISVPLKTIATQASLLLLIIEENPLFPYNRGYIRVHRLTLCYAGQLRGEHNLLGVRGRRHSKKSNKESKEEWEQFPP